MIIGLSVLVALLFYAQTDIQVSPVEWAHGGLKHIKPRGITGSICGSFRCLIEQ